MNYRISFLSMLCVLAASVGAKSEKDMLYNKVGVCTSPTNGGLVKSAGGHHLEVAISSFLIPEKSDAEFERNAQIAKECPVPMESANGFFPGDIKLTGPHADMERALRYTEVAMRRASEIGLKTAVLGSGAAREIPEGWTKERAVEQFCNLLVMMGPIAKKYGVTIVIEPLRKQECNFINTVQEGYEIAKKVKHPNIRVLADIYHMTQENEGPQSIVLAGREYLRHVHIAENAKRTAPGVDGDDFTPYFRALKKIKYKGTISIECGWSNINEQLKNSFDEVKRQLHQVYDK